jgi:hypothetical protein
MQFTFITSFSEWTLIIFTIVLAAATIALAWYTKELVLFQVRQKRRAQVYSALALAESFRKLDPDDFIKQLSVPGSVPEPASACIRELALHSALFVDDETRRMISQLRQWIDNVQQNTSIGGNGPAITKLFVDSRDRLSREINVWRDELSS